MPRKTKKYSTKELKPWTLVNRDKKKKKNTEKEMEDKEPGGH